MAGRLDSKVALVTGASRGIGRAIALTFAKEGGAVIVNYVTRPAEAERAVQTLGPRVGSEPLSTLLREALALLSA